jgi:NADPH2:quinone reductase
VRLHNARGPNRQTEIAAAPANLVAAGQVRVEIAATLPLEEVRQAHALIESGHTRGKIILSLGA